MLGRETVLGRRTPQVQEEVLQWGLPSFSYRGIAGGADLGRAVGNGLVYVRLFGNFSGQTYGQSSCHAYRQNYNKPYCFNFKLHIVNAFFCKVILVMKRA